MVFESDDERAEGRRGALGTWLGTATYWYFTGLLVAMGFSLGLYLLRPDPEINLDRSDWLNVFTWMDGKWYKQIAVEGYHYDAARRSNVAFFPVYPLLARVLMAPSGLRPEVALLIVSNLSLLAALALLGVYVRERHPTAPAELSDYVVLSAALLPTGCFLRLAYSESTCLLLMLLAMRAMLRRWPLWLIAVTVGLATAACPVGVALLAPFAIHICSRDAHGTQAAPRFRDLAPRLFAIRNVRRLAIYLPLAAWGLISFLAYEAYAFGDPFATFKAHQIWRVRPLVPWPEKLAALATLEPIRSIYSESGSTLYWANWQPHTLPWFSLQFANPIFFVSAVMLTALGAWRRWLNLEETSLAALMLLIPYLGRGYEMGMNSMGRFVSVVAPLYLVLGQLLVRAPDPLRIMLFSLSAFLLAMYTALYAATYAIF